MDMNRMTTIPQDMAEDAEAVCQESMLIVKDIGAVQGEIINIGPRMAKRIRTNAKAIADLSKRIESIKAGE